MIVAVAVGTGVAVGGTRVAVGGTVVGLGGTVVAVGKGVGVGDSHAATRIANANMNKTNAQCFISSSFGKCWQVTSDVWRALVYGCQSGKMLFPVRVRRTTFDPSVFIT